MPSELRERRGNTALFRSANSLSIDTERLARDLAYDHLGPCLEEVRDAFFPGVGLIAGGLLRGYVLLLEAFIRPPWRVVAIEMHRLGK